MSDSKTAICNMALGHLGVQAEIANVDTEQSPEAAACRRFYPTALKEVFRDFAWPMSTKLAELGLVTSLADDDEHPTTEWAYQYQYPSDCITFRRIVGALRTDTHESRIPYREYHGTAGTAIFTDEQNAIGEYTILVDDPTRYPADMAMALSFLIAGYIAPSVTGGDPFKKGDRAMQLYSMRIGAARVNAVNEEQSDLEPEAGSINARNE